MKKTLPIRLRYASESDVPFIFSSWLKSYRSSGFASPLDNQIYFENQHKLIEALVSKNPVVIACDKDDPSQLYGYICAGYTDGLFTVHYIYVKHKFRNMGIGLELLNAFSHDTSSASIYTHHTRAASKIAPRFRFIFHPYVLMKDVFDEQEEDVKLLENSKLGEVDNDSEAE